MSPLFGPAFDDSSKHDAFFVDIDCAVCVVAVNDAVVVAIEDGIDDGTLLELAFVIVDVEAKLFIA